MENNRIYDPESPTSLTNDGMTVGTTSTLVLAENLLRKYFIVVNNSANLVYLGIGQPAVIDKGIPLVYKGSNYECSLKESANITAPIYAISSIPSAITFVEGV